MNEEIEKFRAEVAERITANGNNRKLQQLSADFQLEAVAAKYMHNFNWLGRPIIQYPQDIAAIQELIWQVKPDLIIENGVAHGGSLILSASMLAMLEYCDAAEQGKTLNPTEPVGKVVGIDIEIRPHNREAIEKHPMSNRITLLEGSSIEEGIVSQVHELARGHKKILVLLDSNHTHDHVLAELESYAPLVSVGSYCVVFDTVVEDLPDELFPDRPWGKGDNPKTALHAYLKEHDEFEIDRTFENQIMITVAPDGFLKRVK